MPITEHATFSAVTVGTSELSIVSGTTTLQNDTTDGVYQLWVDGVANMAKGDEFAIRIYEKVKAAGTKRQVFKAVLSDAQSEPFVAPNLILMHGWDMTIQKVAGTDRAFDASIRKVA
jgi:hypothetical protein